ncbi:type II CAAX prenyl endopeptidase Rce1 family protein [Cryptosporangium sp. NPDC051539]|uniref:CPBP family glutamic-type intramembrane protease n=1 Tax=Cryptosporangium sp. NPDC051539 TaxID=3363962 RepID=UPI0037A91277
MTTTVRSRDPLTRTARREAVYFIALQSLLALAATAVAAAEDVDVRRIEDASPLGQAAAYGMALTPLVAAFAVRWRTTGRLRGWGFRRTSWRALLLAWAVGVLPVLAAALAVWTTGAGRFDGAAAAVALGLGSPLLAAVTAGTLMVLPYVLLALAEDVGWRGLLVTRLRQISRPRTVYLVSGTAWSLSHVWLLLFLGGVPEGVSPLYAVAMFTIGTTALGAILAAMQLRWGMWPGVVAHAAVNAVLYHFTEPATATTGTATAWIATETGLAYAAAMVLAALVFLRWFATAAAHQPHTSGTGDASRRK